MHCPMLFSSLELMLFILFPIYTNQDWVNVVCITIKCSPLSILGNHFLITWIASIHPSKFHFHFSAFLNHLFFSRHNFFRASLLNHYQPPQIRWPFSILIFTHLTPKFPLQYLHIQNSSNQEILTLHFIFFVL